MQYAVYYPKDPDMSVFARGLPLYSYDLGRQDVSTINPMLGRERSGSLGLYNLGELCRDITNHQLPNGKEYAIKSSSLRGDFSGWNIYYIYIDEKMKWKNTWDTQKNSPMIFITFRYLWITQMNGFIFTIESRCWAPKVFFRICTPKHRVQNT